MRLRLVTMLPLVLVACSSSGADPQQTTPTHPPPMQWRPLPEAPRNVGGPAEAYTQTVSAPPPTSSASAAPASLVVGEGTCTTNDDCVVTFETANCCAFLCAPGKVVSKTVQAMTRAKQGNCPANAKCPPPDVPCASSTVSFRPVCDHGLCKADPITMTKGSVPNSSETITSMQPAFAKCYKDELGKNPKAAGRTRMVVKIGADGKPSLVDATQIDGLSDALVACLKGVVEKTSFSPPVGGAGTLVIPIDLKP